MIAGAFTGGVLHGSGYALYVWCGKFFALMPLGNIAARVVLFNVITAAVFIFMVTRMALRNWESRRVDRPAIVGQALASLPIVWFASGDITLDQSCVAENSLLFHLLLVAVSSALLISQSGEPTVPRWRRRWISLATFSLAVSYFPPAAAALPVILFPWIRSRERRIRLPMALILVLVVSAAPLAASAVRALQEPGVNVSHLLSRSQTFEGIREYLEIYTRLRSLLFLATHPAQMAVLNPLDYLEKFYPNPLHLAVAATAMVGVLGSLRTHAFPVLWMILIAGAMAFVRMFNGTNEADGQSFVFPALVTVWCCWGTSVLYKSTLRRMKTLRRWPAWKIVAGVGLALAGALTLRVLFRPSMGYRHDRFATTYADRLLAELPGKATLFSHAGLSYFPLWAVRVVENRRPDVELLSSGLLVLEWSRSWKRSSIATPIPAKERLRLLISDKFPQRPVFFTGIGWHHHIPGKEGLWSRLEPGLESFDLVPLGFAFRVAPQGSNARWHPRTPDIEWPRDRWTKGHWQWFFLDLALLSEKAGNLPAHEKYLRKAAAIAP